MNIGLSVIGFYPGKMGGMETYFKGLLAYLQETDHENNYAILCNTISAGDFRLSNPLFSLETFDFNEGTMKWLVRGVLKNALSVDILSPKIDRLGLDVIHHPFTLLDPINLKSPSVLTFFDMQQEFYPEFFSRRELRMRKANFRRSIKQANRIIVSSEFTKHCLIERYGFPEEKIDVIYFGYAREYRIIDSTDILDQARNKYDLRKPFLFYPAASWPHKNHKLLLSAIKIIKDNNGFDGQLVLTGIVKASHDEMLREIGRLDLKKDVKFLGYVPYEDLPSIYNLARMLVFPSLFEGFGIPLVEAMACGCPVACSNATTLPEIIGAAGVLFDPTSPMDIAEKTWSVWSDNGRRQGMRAAGLERVTEFDWGNAAKKTVAVYRKANEDRRRLDKIPGGR